jgi:hypothetical protein
VLGWDEKRELPDGVDHASDAVLYSLRRLAHYNRESHEAQDDSPQAVAKRQEAEWVAKRLALGRRMGNDLAARAAWGRR